MAACSSLLPQRRAFTRTPEGIIDGFEVAAVSGASAGRARRPLRRRTRRWPPSGLLEGCAADELEEAAVVPSAWARTLAARLRPRLGARASTGHREPRL